MQDKTEEGNRIIADFMLRFNIGYYDELQFHSSWDWLMPAFRKAKNVLQEHRLKVNGVTKGDELFLLIQDGVSCVNISEAFTRLVQFIQWYNTQSTKTDKT